MIVIKATCPACGDVDLTPADLRLNLEETLAEPVRAFEFRCTSCTSPVIGETTAEVADSLERAGVATKYVALPAEMREPRWGPPISEDDVISFGLWLEGVTSPLFAARIA